MPQSSDNLQDESIEVNKKKNLCIKIVQFVFAKGGLALIVVCYSIAGALIFIVIERDGEAKNCLQSKIKEFVSINTLKVQLLNYVSNNMTNNPYDLTKDDDNVATENIEGWLEELRDKILRNHITYKYIGEDCTSLKWNFWNALLFSFTIISTIGK